MSWRGIPKGRGGPRIGVNSGLFAKHESPEAENYYPDGSSWMAQSRPDLPTERCARFDELDRKLKHGKYKPAVKTKKPTGRPKGTPLRPEVREAAVGRLEQFWASLGAKERRSRLRAQLANGMAKLTPEQISDARRRGALKRWVDQRRVA